MTPTQTLIDEIKHKLKNWHWSLSKAKIRKLIAIIERQQKTLDMISHPIPGADLSSHVTCKSILLNNEYIARQALSDSDEIAAGDDK